MATNKLGLMEIRQALYDKRFQALFPEYEKDIKEFLNNPGCPCNGPLYKSILKHPDRLKQYFPTKEIEPIKVEDNSSKKAWTVIDCHIDELENKLNNLPRLRQQVAVARYEDKVVVLVKELEF